MNAMTVSMQEDSSMITVFIKDDNASSVAQQVYDQLWSEQGLRTTTADIEIEAEQGAVALNGRVRTGILRRQADRLARMGLNGWQLHNNLIADDQLAMDLAARLAADPARRGDWIPAEQALPVYLRNEVVSKPAATFL